MRSRDGVTFHARDGVTSRDGVTLGPSDGVTSDVIGGLVSESPSLGTGPQDQEPCAGAGHEPAPGVSVARALIGQDRGVDDGGPRSDLKLAFWRAIDGQSTV